MGSFYSTKNVCIVEAEAPPISNGITLVHCSAISPFVTIWTIIFMTIIIIIMIVHSITAPMGRRKFQLTKRKNVERKRLKSRMLKSVTGRPKKGQKKYIHVHDSTLNEVSIEKNSRV